MTFWPLTSYSDFQTDQTFHQFHDTNTEFNRHRITNPWSICNGCLEFWPWILLGTFSILTWSYVIFDHKMIQWLWNIDNLLKSKKSYMQERLHFMYMQLIIPHPAQADILEYDHIRTLQKVLDNVGIHLQWGGGFYYIAHYTWSSTGGFL